MTGVQTCALPISASLRRGPFPWEPSRGPNQDVGGRSRGGDAPVFGTTGIPLSPCSEELTNALREKARVRPRVSGELKRMRKGLREQKRRLALWEPRSLGFREPLIGAGGMRKSGSVEKKCSDPARALPPSFRGVSPIPRGMRKTGSAEKIHSRRKSPPARPVDEPKGMRKSGSVEKKCSDSGRA